ncbi:phosphoribosylanthranilate isomerase [Lachnospiraceae bacterium JLR.KK008]
MRRETEIAAGSGDISMSGMQMANRLGVGIGTARRTGIKLCGIRRIEDAGPVNEFMPDYIGFIFWSHSARYVTLPQALSLRGRIDQRIPAVGVFVNENPERIKACVDAGAIQVIQLHGQETKEEIISLKEELPDIPVWQAFRIRSRGDLRQAERSAADEILLDNGGGTGECFDHRLLVGIGRRYILAGGLEPGNISQIIRTYRPYMVDVSSGVETEGRKDREKIKRVMQAVATGNC